MKYTFWQLPVHKDARGALCAIEDSYIPFKVKRMYFLYDVKSLRGGHAHKKEKEVFVCIKGKFTARIHDGKREKIYKLTKPGQALYTDAMVWHEFDKFSKDAVMLAISSLPYDGHKGYIMDFEQFLTLCHKKSS